jgi:hypothetical protein
MLILCSYYELDYGIMVSDLSFLFDIFLIEVKDDGAYHQKRHALVKHVLYDFFLLFTHVSDFSIYLITEPDRLPLHIRHPQAFH